VERNLDDIIWELAENWRKYPRAADEGAFLDTIRREAYETRTVGDKAMGETV